MSEAISGRIISRHLDGYLSSKQTRHSTGLRYVASKQREVSVRSGR